MEFADIYNDKKKRPLGVNSLVAGARIELEFFKQAPITAFLDAILSIG